MSSRDFEEFLESLNAHGVRYLLVGAHAVAFHAKPRATRDLDVYVEPSAENAERLLAAIRAFFAGADLGFEVGDVVDPDTVLQLGVAPVRIDILSCLTAIRDFEAAWAGRVEARFGRVPTQFLGLDDLIAEKEATGRHQDLADAESLRAVRKP